MSDCCEESDDGDRIYLIKEVNLRLRLKVLDHSDYVEREYFIVLRRVVGELEGTEINGVTQLSITVCKTGSCRSYGIHL